MGATTFYEKVDNPDLQEAFRSAVEAARYERGHGGYSGTIGEKNSVVKISATPVPYDEAVRIANRLIDQGDPRVNDKWGPAGALPFIDVPAATVARTVTVTVTVPNVPGQDADAVLLAAVTEKVRLRAGERVGRVLANGHYDARRLGLPAPERKYRTVTATPREASETRYVVGNGSWENGFSSQAEARAHAMRLAEQWTGNRTESWAVTAVTRRSSGHALVTVTRELVSTKWTVQVEVENVVQVPAKTSPDGWLLFGWASC